MSAGGAKYERSSGCARSSRRCSRHSISRPTTGSHASCESSTSSCASRSLQCPCSSCALYAVCRVFSRSAAAALAGHCYGLRSYAWLGRPRTRRAVWWPRVVRGRQGWRPPARAALCSSPPKALCPLPFPLADRRLDLPSSGFGVRVMTSEERITVNSSLSLLYSSLRTARGLLSYRDRHRQ